MLRRTAAVSFFIVLLGHIGSGIITPAQAESYPLPQGLEGVVNIKTDMGAVGDGQTDDTEAFREALTELGREKYVLVYVPEGEYLVTEPLAFGNRRVWLHGESAERTIIRLAAHAPKFQDPDNPQPLLTTANAWDRRDEWASAVMFRQGVRNVTLEVGPGNPGAVGLNYMTSNQGAVTNVIIRSADPDGVGKWGLSFVMAWPGPGLIDDVRIEGFDYGIYSTIHQHSLTFKDITLRDQRVAGVFNANQILNFHRLTSRQSRPGVPAIEQHSGFITLVDAELAGSGPAAINRQDSGLYLRDVEATGYGRVASGVPDDTSAGRVVEMYTQPVGSVPGHEPAPSRIEPPRTPHVPWGSLDDWTRVEDHIRPDEKQNHDYTAALQRAIDSGAKTVYVGPRVFFQLHDTIVIRGRVERITGLGGRFFLKRRQFPKDRPLFRIAPGDHPVVIERFGSYGSVAWPIDHAGKRPLILRNIILGGAVTVGDGSTLFMEDACFPSLKLEPGGRVYGWQFNSESRDGWNVFNNGGELWVMGHKTEGGYEAGVIDGGGVTEVLGTYYYNNSGPKTPSLFVVREGRLTVVGAPNTHPVYVREFHHNQPVDLPRAQATGWYASPR